MIRKNTKVHPNTELLEALEEREQIIQDIKAEKIKDYRNVNEMMKAIMGNDKTF